MRIDNFVKNISIDELLELRDKVNSRINSYEDGYFYICDVRSYGRSWKENHVNPYTLQELCYQYFGEDGIVDVYTNNPDLNIENYGNVKFVPTKEDLEKWKNYTFLENHIPLWEKEIEEWKNRDNVPFNQRPLFQPYLKSENIEEYKKEMSQIEGTFVEPVNLKKYSDDES